MEQIGDENVPDGIENPLVGTKIPPDRDEKHTTLKWDFLMEKAAHTRDFSRE